MAGSLAWPPLRPAARSQTRGRTPHIGTWPGQDDSVILLRYVTKGKKGAISYMVKIDTTRRPVRPRWWILSATGAYKGLQGKGDESENATYTVSTLTGRVWR